VPDHQQAAEDAVEYIRAWLRASAALDRLVEATEPAPNELSPSKPLPPSLVAAYRLRSQSSWQLGRISVDIPTLPQEA
jgi:hypothetical protein